MLIVLLENLYPKLVEYNEENKNIYDIIYVASHDISFNPDDLRFILDASHFRVRHRGTDKNSYSWKFRKEAKSWNFIIDIMTKEFIWIGGGN